VALVFCFGGTVLIVLGLLSAMVGLAYAGQIGALVAVGVGVILIVLGAGFFLVFWRRAVKKSSPK
jgi:hypothetical protein